MAKLTEIQEVKRKSCFVFSKWKFIYFAFINFQKLILTFEFILKIMSIFTYIFLNKNPPTMPDFLNCFNFK